MEKSNLDNFVRGWIVGAFKPSIYDTNDVEFAIQEFKKGDKEASHCHKIATEITVIISGEVNMKGDIYTKGDVIKIAPGEYTDFQALEDTVTAVLKIPGALNDKYLEENEG